MIPRSGSDVYIQDGRITRSTSSQGARRLRISWVPLLLVTAALCTLIVTNPANGLGHWIPDQYWNIPNKQSSGLWFSLIRPQDTNFGLFTLSRTIDGVSVTGLLNTVELCQFDSPNDDDELQNLLCGWIDDTFCHGKPLLDWNDLTFTVNRLLCWVLMASMISPLFIHRAIRKSAPFGVITSVLQQPTIFDLIRVNLLVYPALVSMDRLIRSYLVIDGYTWRFLAAFFLLVFVIGGVCNQIASSFQQRQPIVGMGAAFAACLGYHRAVSSKSLFQFADRPFSASTLFWLDASLLLMQANQPGQLVAWIMGGFAGNTFGHMHQQWLAEALRSNMKRAVHKTVKQFLNWF